ncbi:MAG: glycogen/starch/alpha-glucan phosphorylase [Ruminococcaceae bacterium]|nr:glycogen/starch/alpha-glucan phosphorylase [Oscillospiraceae bacterium]
MDLTQIMHTEYGKSVGECTKDELYRALVKYTCTLAEEKRKPYCGKKKLYYLSAEFLIGKLLSCNLINLGIYDSVKAELASHGRDLTELEEYENEPSLGNGGLGRLAACFLDSIASLGLPGDGIGLNYHFGLFRQVFRENEQTAEPDRWLTDTGWLRKTDTVYPIRLRNGTVQARMYDLAVIGYENCVNTLHLFDLEGVDEDIVGEGISFDKTDIAHNLTLFLYPDDSDENGRILRICQQYFMVSAAAQLILAEAEARGCRLYDLPDYAVIQINDTHPAMVIPELIRLLTERGLDTDDAIAAACGACAYTNHTILAEALEKWPIRYLKKAVPHLVPVMEILDDKVRRKYGGEETAIIDREDVVHMAHMAVHCSVSTNGVASLHTEILKKEALAPLYRLCPEKFNNKTNGITFRRWLLHCNPALTDFLTGHIGDGFRTDGEELRKLMAYRDDTTTLDGLMRIKSDSKKALADWLYRKQGVKCDPDSVFDIQIKRLHEYKRQQMNALYVIHKYLEIREGRLPERPVTVIFGAKAAPAYVIAQDIIHLILCLQTLTGDPAVRPYLQTVMVENYNVSAAEKLIPACDISEQISLASKEASGTGNMKFMLNGAVTLGTEDGANVEIHRLVGDENIYIFGDTSTVVTARYKAGSYSAKAYYEEVPMIRRAVDFIIGPELAKIGNPVRLRRLYDELTGKDWFMTFPDFADYVKTREKAYRDYGIRPEWAKKGLVNIAMSGYFSSDRTILEYNRDIWHLDRSPEQIHSK